jgi:hypothetical protein
MRGAGGRDDAFGAGAPPVLPGRGPGLCLQRGQGGAHVQGHPRDDWCDEDSGRIGDLAEHPGSGWALRGLLRALEAQRKPVGELKAQLGVSFAAADPALTAAR